MDGQHCIKLAIDDVLSVPEAVEALIRAYPPATSLSIVRRRRKGMVTITLCLSIQGTQGGSSLVVTTLS
jgi:hypothetical protein